LLLLSLRCNSIRARHYPRLPCGQPVPPTGAPLAGPAHAHTAAAGCLLQAAAPKGAAGAARLLQRLLLRCTRACGASPQPATLQCYRLPAPWLCPTRSGQSSCQLLTSPPCSCPQVLVDCCVTANTSHCYEGGCL
jgi:hypothetical protein